MAAERSRIGAWVVQYEVFVSFIRNSCSRDRVCPAIIEVRVPILAVAVCVRASCVGTLERC